MKNLILFLLSAGIAAAQVCGTASFPASVAGDSQLLVAADNVQTKLISSMGSSDTVAVVASNTGWLPNMLATIGSEQVLVTGISGNVLTITRGYASTTPAAHANGQSVSVYIDACYHQRIKSEVVAIENALGPNLANIQQAVVSISATSTNFTAQSPGGSLIVGANVIALWPVPSGVNGTDTGHYYYVSGGSGTPEACLGTGGSAVSGASTGTLIVTCANSHSGAWTLQSATAGIQEAVNYAPDGGIIVLPPGHLAVYATTYITRAVAITAGPGAGTDIGSSSATDVTMQTNGLSVFSVYTNESVKFDGFRVSYLTAQTSGNAIYLNAAGNNSGSTVSNMQMLNVFNGVYEHTVYAARIYGCTIQFYGSGIVLQDAVADNGVSHVFENELVGQDGAYAAVRILSGGGYHVDNNGMHSQTGHMQYGVSLETSAGPTSQIFIIGNQIDGVTTYGVNLAETVDYYGIHVENNLISNFINPSGFIGVFVANAHTIAGLILGNTISPAVTGQTSWLATGIQLNGGGGLLIAGNVITNATYGLYLYNQSNISNLVLGQNDYVNVYGSPLSTNSSGGGTYTNLTYNFTGPVSCAVLAALPAAANGSAIYGTDCNSTCAAGSSTGRTCFRENGAWTH
jgi:hypothetical protein